MLSLTALSSGHPRDFDTFWCLVDGRDHAWQHFPATRFSVDQNHRSIGSMQLV